jgi:predicted nucleic acid-binding protein
MQYWDASALVPLCVEEPTSAVLRTMASGSALVTWCLSSVEITSAIERRAREGALTAQERAAALANLALLAQSWTEVTGMGPVRERAIRLLATHRLRAADALQLAAALIAVGDQPSDHEFVCLDSRLRDAAGREGFTAAPTDQPSVAGFFKPR